MSPIASRVLLRLALIFGVIVLGGVLIWGIAGLGPQRTAPERGAELLGAEAVRAKLAEQGLEVLVLERDGGLYRARVRDPAGERTLHIDGTSGEIIAMPTVTGPALPLDTLRRRLQDAGYSEIGGIGWSKGTYDTRATGPEGRRWRLRLDTYSGEIVARVPVSETAQ